MSTDSVPPADPSMTELPSESSSSQSASSDLDPERETSDAVDSPAAGSGPSKNLLAVYREMFLRDLPLLVRVALRSICIGFGIGLFQALWMFPKRANFSATNQLEVPFRNAALINMGTWMGLFFLGAALFTLVKPDRKRLPTVDDAVAALLPLFWLWPIPLFFDWEVFNGGTLNRVIIALIWAFGLERSLRHTFRVVPEFLGRLPRRLPPLPASIPRYGFPLLLTGIILWFSFFCAHYTVMQHQRMATTGFDLGLFDNLLYNLSQGEWFRAEVDIGNRGGRHIQYHANFLAYLFVPFYALSPRAETLLLIQAWLVGASAIPLYLLGAHRLQSKIAGFVLASAFLLHEAVQGPVFYDFHFLTISPFFVGWTLYFFDRGLKWQLAVAWTCAVLLREDQGAILGAAALVYLLMGHRPVLAFTGGLFGVVWLALMRFYVMPLHGPDGTFHQHIGIFQAMVAPGDAGFGGVIKTMITNPVFTLNNLVEEKKLEYVLILAAPFALLPFRSLRLLVLFIPAAVFTLGTANYPPPVMKSFQYTMYWMPLLVLGTVLKLDEWKKAGKPAFVAAGLGSIFVVSVAMSVSAGALFQQHTFQGGFRRIVFEITDEEKARFLELHQLVHKIPPTAGVTASESVVPHVSNRTVVHTLRQQIGDVDYILFFEPEVRRGDQADHLLRELGALGEQKFGVIERTKNFQLWKRGAPQQDNLRALQSLGHFRNLGPDGKEKKRNRGRSKSPSRPRGPHALGAPTPTPSPK